MNAVDDWTIHENLLTSAERTGQSIQEFSTKGSECVLLKQLDIESQCAEQSSQSRNGDRLVQFLTHQFIKFVQIRELNSVGLIELATNRISATTGC